MQSGADGCDRFLTVQIVRHFICHTHITIQIEVQVDVADAEMMA